jgi:hypothetical protein
VQERTDEPSARQSITSALSISMPPEIRELERRTAAHYLRDNTILPTRQQELLRTQLALSNSVEGELHARASFAVSCFILVAVGCALGMMFRSGNFLTAFALSVMPALLCIALIVTGQHTLENIPRGIGPEFVNPLRMGIWLIWSGNIAVAAIGLVLLWRLQRQ